MPEEPKGPLARMWRGIRRKTEEAVARQEEAFVLGRIAGKTVTDDAGNVLVEAGHRIDAETIERAEAAGKLHALAAAAATAQAQDLREKADAFIAGTPEGREARALDSAEEYAEARRYVGRTAGVDVTDVRGAVIVPAGKEITEQDVRAAREAGLLAALVFAAQLPPQAQEEETPAPAPEEPARPAPEAPAPTPRRSLPLVTPPEEKPGGRDQAA